MEPRRIRTLGFKPLSPRYPGMPIAEVSARKSGCRSPQPPDKDTLKRHNAAKLNTAQRRCLNPDIAIPRYPCVCTERATVQSFRTEAGYLGTQYFGVILRLVGGLGIWPSLILGSARHSAPLAASSAPRFSISGSIVSACL